ncbi:hypothetical protein [Citrobacter werkmanii]|uniref:hypothetical protein n=1 Tax=Citrobacter werkmanii TaxID=67827 RepID=UPI00264B07CC|nr:hypothetical protein [Citrobacter werkmanii]MDN8559123.1 hypothetical protein [Citrobacter werkmanii]
MSARERFFRKIQQNNNSTSAYSNVVAVDIARFCRQMDELAEQMRQWLDGSGIKVSTSTTYLSDLSTVGASLNGGAARYAITAIHIQNGERRVSIIPEQLYQGTDKGCSTMIVNAPDLFPGRQYFYLSIAPEAGWYIRNFTRPATTRVLLTEEVFFRTIESLV